MKSILFAMLVIPIVSFAQFSKGDKYIGGTFRLNLQTNNNSGLKSEVYNTFDVNPFAGYLLNSKLAIGAQLGYSSFTTKYYPDLPSKSINESKSFSIGLRGRKFFTITENFMLSIDGLIDFERGFQTNTTSTAVNKMENYELALGLWPSLIFFPSPKWGVEASFGSLTFSHSQSLSVNTNTNNFFLDYGTLQFGLAYYFRKSN